MTLAAALACGPPSVSEKLEAYHAAVGQIVASGEMGRDADPAAVRLPARRDRRIEVSEHRVGLFDFLALQGCRLGVLVGERNSQLGRVMVPVRRLVYESELLEAGDACLAGLGERRREEIAGILEQKRDELPQHIWNAVWVGGEMEGYLAAMRGDPAFLVDPEQSAEGVLHEIGRVLERRPFGSRDARDLEGALSGLRGQPVAGALVIGMERARIHLEEISDLLGRVEPAGCGRTERRLVEVFQRHYVSIVQPELVELDREAGPIVDGLARVYRASRPASVPASMQGFYETVLSPRGGLRSGYRAAVVRHASSWSPTLVACEAIPGQASTGRREAG